MTIVGDGYKMQMRRSLAACKDTDPAHYEAILPVYMEIFGENCNYQMHAYEGIGELLAFARGKGDEAGRGLQQAPRQAVKTVEYVFGTDAFDTVVGEREGIPKKPDPRGALEAAKEMGVAPEKLSVFRRYQHGYGNRKKCRDGHGGSPVGIPGPGGAGGLCPGVSDRKPLGHDPDPFRES